MLAATTCRRQMSFLYLPYLLTIRWFIFMHMCREQFFTISSQKLKRAWHYRREFNITKKPEFYSKPCNFCNSLKQQSYSRNSKIICKKITSYTVLFAWYLIKNVAGKISRSVVISHTSMRSVTYINKHVLFSAKNRFYNCIPKSKEGVALWA